jgi:hypothetical protein
MRSYCDGNYYRYIHIDILLHNGNDEDDDSNLLDYNDSDDYDNHNSDLDYYDNRNVYDNKDSNFYIYEMDLR